MQDATQPELLPGGQVLIACIVIGFYLLLLLVLGFVGYLKSRGGEEDYYLAGRDQGWLISSLTIMATFFSSFALLGAPGMVYREGVVTDNGNQIIDCYGLDIDDPVALETRINAIVGVVTNGLFAARPADILLIGGADGISRHLPA